MPDHYVHELDVTALVQAVTQHIERRGVTHRVAAKETGLAPSLFTRLLRHGEKPSADGLTALLAWIGQPHAFTTQAAAVEGQRPSDFEWPSFAHVARTPTGWRMDLSGPVGDVEVQATMHGTDLTHLHDFATRVAAFDGEAPDA